LYDKKRLIYYNQISKPPVYNIFLRNKLNTEYFTLCMYVYIYVISQYKIFYA